MGHLKRVLLVSFDAPRSSPYIYVCMGLLFQHFFSNPQAHSPILPYVVPTFTIFVVAIPGAICGAIYLYPV